MSGIIQKYAAPRSVAAPSMYRPGKSASYTACHLFDKVQIGRVPTFRSNSTAAHSTDFDLSASGSLPVWHEPFFTLERSIGGRTGADKKLWETGAFAAGISPDLPVAASWAEWARKLWNRHADSQALITHDDQQVAAPHSWKVTTVACQTRSRQQLQQRLRAVAGVGRIGQPPEADCGANAVLIVSGSHPAHNLAAAIGRTPHSFELLQTAAAMRKQGLLPRSLGLWAVENPLQNDASRLERKVDAGAEVVLTQPPLLWEQFDAWITDAHRRGLTQQARVVVGVPMLTSVGNLQFWLQLCNASGADGAAALVQDFRAHEADGKEKMLEFCASYNRNLVRKVLNIKGVAGLHIMPLTKVARQQVQQMLHDGILAKQ